MKNLKLELLAFLVLLGCAATSLPADQFRPPSIPLVACDPYFSIWSSADKLTDTDTVHWTGKPHRLTSSIRIDSTRYRVMGAQPAGLPPLEQKSVRVLPTRTIYVFEGGGIRLSLTFLTPALPDDLDLLSRPVTYLSWELRSTDGGPHEVHIDFTASGELVVNTPDQRVRAEKLPLRDLEVIQVGSAAQPVLAKRGDDIRIDWGYLYVAAPKRDASGFIIVDPDKEPTAPDWTVEMSFDAVTVSERPITRWLMLAYDDLYSIQYMTHNLRPYWRRNGWGAADLLLVSAREYESLVKRCVAFDEELMNDLTRAGGANYAALCALAYRQCFAAGKFVADDNGQPLQFCKENHSNGCIGTSDVFYPMSPQFLLFGPTLAKSFIVPFMNYAASERWRFPFAPHDLGQYPHANGQRYGGGERSEKNQMPVEESGNLLILFAAVAQMEGHADFAGLYWPQLRQWAEYLRAKGFDPENQLCTDDFAGHLAHNVNLSAKAICGLAAFSKLCRMRGEKERADEYYGLAKQFASQWIQEAQDEDHYRLAFDRSGTWSQKYNLVWDQILRLDLFPDYVKRSEMAHYRKVQKKYGLPLDNRQTYTKLDWILWTATLTQDRADFEALVDPVARFLNETPDRVPMTDWYFTDSGKRRGFTARPVVGGVFLQMLYDKDVWAKYANREKTKASDWAPMPRPPRTEPLIPTSERQAATWRYTTERPAGNWRAADYDDSSWQESPAGFGTEGTPGAVARTTWNSSDIWMRRVFRVEENVPERAALRIHHDEDVQVFLNGVQVLRRRGYTTQYQAAIIDASALQKGRNVMAVHCHQTTGGQYIDVGIDAIIPDEQEGKRKTSASIKEPFCAYLMAYFGPEEKLFYAVSEDACHWTALAGGKPVFDAGVRLRDPFINRAKGKFHMVHTKGWDYPTIFHWESDDLIDWKGGPIDVVPADRKRAWAPEFFYEPDDDLFYIYWASVLNGYNTMHMVTTRDWSNITPDRSRVFYSIGIHNIDLTIVKYNDTYYGFHKPGDVDDRMGNLLSTSEALDPWHNTFAETFDDVFSGETKPTEGPEVIQLIGQQRWYIYGDPFHSPLEAWETTDFATFRKISVSPPECAKHGSMIPLTAGELQALKTKYPG